MDNSKKLLRYELQAKIREKQISRSNKITKENILKKSMGEVGIDYDKFKEDLEAVKKSGVGITYKTN